MWTFWENGGSYLFFIRNLLWRQRHGDKLKQSELTDLDCKGRRLAFNFVFWECAIYSDSGLERKAGPFIQRSS